MMNDSAIGELLRGARLRMRLTQKEVGKRIGVTAQCYGQIERGKKRVRPNRLEAICRVLRLPVQEMLEGVSADEIISTTPNTTLDERLVEVMICLDTSKKRVLLRTGEALMEEL